MSRMWENKGVIVWGAAMGGISVLVLAGFGLAMLAVLGIAAAMFVAGVVIAVIFACRTKARRAQGKKIGWRILIPTLLMAVSAPVLIWFSLVLFIPAFEDWVDVDYSDCSQMVTRHDAAGLKELLDGSLAEEDRSDSRLYRDLARLSIVYEDEECLEVVLDSAKDNGTPVDLNAPLAPYGEEESSDDSSYALIMTVSSDYSSPEAVRILIENGASVGVVDRNGRTPLHLVCSGSCVDADSGENLEALDETYTVARILLEAGASLDVEDLSGNTPWDLCVETVADLADRGVLDEKGQAEALNEFSALLGRS